MSTSKTLSSSSILASSVFVFGFSHSSFAQQPSSDQVVEEVVVTGIRSSLENAMDLKRDSQGVVDAISAEDIGKFPDANLAESLQRITGVSIDRQNNEGNQITVRGLGPSFNMVTLNGRQMPVASSPEQESIASATQSRAFNFAEIASESVSAVEVFKTGRADLTTGGMGATVNIKTARPIQTGNKFVINTKAVHDSSVEDGDEVTPEAGILFSQASDDGTLGVLINASYSDRQFSEVSTHTDGWLRDERDVRDENGNILLDESGQPLVGAGYAVWCGDASSQCNDAPYVYRPVTNISEIKNFKRTRTNAQFVAQFAPNDQITATIDYTLSRFTRQEDRFGTGLFGAVNIGDNENNVLTDDDFARNTVLSPSFTLSSVDRITNDLNLSNAADSLVYDNRVRIKNDSYGFNLEWNVTDELSLSFDAHNSTAISQPNGELNDNLAILQGPLGINFGFDYSSSGIDVLVDDSNPRRGLGTQGSDRVTDENGEVTIVGLREGVSEFQDPDGFSPLGTVIRNIAIKNEVDQIQLTADWNTDTLQVTGGASYVNYEVNTNAISSGFRFQGLGDCIDCGELITRTSIDAPSGFQVVNEFDVSEVIRRSFPTQSEEIVSGTPNTFFGVTEESIALFLSGSMDLELSNFETRVTAGLRYETTDVTGSAFQTFPIALRVTSASEGEVVFEAGAEDEFFEVNESYDFLLPFLDVQVNVTEDMLGRFSYNRSIARPDLNALRPITTISDYRPGNQTASRGNPGLKPYQSDNIDFSFEWYYSEGSYASAALFYKSVDDYIATETIQTTIPDINGNPLLDPQNRFNGDEVESDPNLDSPAIFDTTLPLNSESREITGLELAVQHLFGESGFGVQANYTVVDSDAEFDQSNFSDQSILIGLSDSANLVGFFENDLFSARLAANWRDEFLFALGQLRATNEPTFFDEYLQLDFSSSFNINDNLTAVFEVLNITGEDQRQTGRYSEQFLFENDQKPRFALGIRGNF